MIFLDIIDFLARAVTSLWGILIFCIIIFLWFIYSRWRFKNIFDPILHCMREANSILEKFDDANDMAIRFHELDESISKMDFLRNSWNEFRETLLFPTAVDPETVIYHSQSAAAFFSEDALLRSQINLRYYNALPNLLTGVGILGTFVGLAGGIHLAGNGLAKPQLAHVALQHLLGGASLAFLTSIVGLITSLLFSGFEKRRLYRFGRLRQEWVSGLHKRLRRITLEQLSQNMLSQSRQQSLVLEQFTEQLSFQLKESLEKAIASAMPGTLDASVTAPLTKALDKVWKAVEEFGRQQAQADEESLRTLSTEFITALHGIAGEELHDLADTIKGLSTILTRQIETVTEQQEQMRRQSEDSAQSMAELLEESATTLRKEFTDSVEKMFSRLDASVGRMAEELDKTTETFKETVGNLSNSADDIQAVLSNATELMEYLDQLIASSKRSHGTLERTAAAFCEAAEKAQGAVNQAREVVKEVEQAAGSIARAVQDYRQIADQLTANWQNYEARFDKVDESLAHTFRELQEWLDGYHQAGEEFLAKVSGYMAEISSTLAGVAKEIGDGGEDLTEAVSRLQQTVSKLDWQRQWPIQRTER